jgi:hypothetical protein
MNLGSNETTSMCWDIVHPSFLTSALDKTGNLIRKIATKKNYDDDQVLGATIWEFRYFSVNNKRVQPTGWDMQEISQGYSSNFFNTISGAVGAKFSLTQKWGTVAPSAGNDFPFKSSMWGIYLPYVGFNGKAKYTVSVGFKGGWYEQMSVAGLAGVEVENPYIPTLPPLGGSESKSSDSGYDIQLVNWERSLNIGLEYGGFGVYGLNGLSAGFSAVQHKLMRQEDQSVYNFKLGLGNVISAGYTIYENMVPECDAFSTGPQKSHKWEWTISLPLTGEGADYISLGKSAANTSLQISSYRITDDAGIEIINGASLGVKASFGEIKDLSIFGWRPFGMKRAVSDKVEAVNQLIAPPVFYSAVEESPNNADKLWLYNYRKVIEKALKGEINDDNSVIRKKTEKELEDMHPVNIKTKEAE